MNIEERVNAFAKLGNYILDNNDDLQQTVALAYRMNSWFTPENTNKALRNIAAHFLNKDLLKKWVTAYPVSLENTGKTVAIVAAGNIPMVAFHDILAVLISGHQLLIKLSEKDKTLLPFIFERLIEIEPKFAGLMRVAERMENFDAIIATGSNNSARYFHYYFSKYKNIIRSNRNSVAVLNGKESIDDLQQLGSDVFDYFGLGCRNVSKIFVPEDFDLMRLKEGFRSFYEIADHNQYRNNLDYQRTLYLMNQNPLIDIDFINIVEVKGLHSPISCLYYEYYTSVEDVKEYLHDEATSIQCVVGNIEGALSFGKSQQPGLFDYADNVDTMKFLSELNLN